VKWAYCYQQWEFFDYWLPRAMAAAEVCACPSFISMLVTDEEPSFSIVCNPAYSELLPGPRYREDCDRKGIQHKTTLASMACCHLCGCCRPDSGHTVRGVSERVPAINQELHQFQN